MDKAIESITGQVDSLSTTTHNDEGIIGNEQSPVIEKGLSSDPQAEIVVSKTASAQNGAVEPTDGVNSSLDANASYTASSQDSSVLGQDAGLHTSSQEEAGTDTTVEVDSGSAQKFDDTATAAVETVEKCDDAEANDAQGNSKETMEPSVEGASTSDGNVQGGAKSVVLHQSTADAETHSSFSHKIGTEESTNPTGMDEAAQNKDAINDGGRVDGVEVKGQEESAENNVSSAHGVGGTDEQGGIGPDGGAVDVSSVPLVGGEGDASNVKCKVAAGGDGNGTGNDTLGAIEAVASAGGDQA